MFVIRADGNAKIGMGHLMRCLTIAEALKEKTGGTGDAQKILFLCADGDSAKAVEEYGFAVRVLHTDYRCMEQEFPVWEELAETGSVILIDSYYVTDDYLRKLKIYGRTVLLDDMQEHCYPVDAVVNYNAFAEDEVYRKLYRGTDTRIYAGSRYVPVRKQFVHRKYRVTQEVRNVLITTGGGDAQNIAGRILEILAGESGICRKQSVNAHAADEAKCPDQPVHFHVIAGKFNPHLEELQQFANGKSWIHLYFDVRDMASLMEQCDLAITAGGTTIYELAAIGVPLICFSYAQNQEKLTNYIGARGIAGSAGAYHKEAAKTLAEIKRLFLQFAADPEKRIACRERERKMIDGRGAERLAEEVLLGQYPQKSPPEKLCKMSVEF